MPTPTTRTDGFPYADDVPGNFAHSGVPQAPTDADPVAAAFGALIAALGTAAASTTDAAQFDRIAGFRRTALQQRDRFIAGEPSHTVPVRKARAGGEVAS